MQATASGSRSVGRAAQSCTACVKAARFRSRRHDAEIKRLHGQSRSLSSAPLPAPLRHPSTGAATSSTGPFSATLPPSMAKGYGQPLPSTHPHLLKPGELTEGITFAEYESRRRRLMESLPDRSIVVLAGGRLQYSSQSIFYKFRQISDFFYLTGWLEQDAAIILEKSHTNPRGYHMTFFCRSRDADQELWEGARNGPNGAVDIFGADIAMDIAHFTSHLKTFLTQTNTDGPIYVDVPGSTTVGVRSGGPRGSRTAKSIVNFLSGGTSGPRRSSLDLALTSKKSDYDLVVSLLNSSGGRTVHSLREELEKMRIIKSEAEIALMHKAADISSNAHAKVMKRAAAGIGEHELVAEFEYQCALAGSPRPAYLPVCASGPNTMYLHYTSNSQILDEKSLVLIDAGCEYGGYASDITRTFPVSGKFTEPEKDLYNVVLQSLKSSVRMCSEKENINLYDLHEHSRKILLEGFKQIGMDFTKNESLFGRIYPHFVGHPLGLDLHDCPSFQRSTRLEAGNVVTVEPGIFMPEHPAIPKHYQNIAIRLEDEVLVAKEHPIVLSANAPIEIVDIETCCQGLLDYQP